MLDPLAARKPLFQPAVFNLLQYPRNLRSGGNAAGDDFPAAQGESRRLPAIQHRCRFIRQQQQVTGHIHAFAIGKHARIAGSARAASQPGEALLMGVGKTQPGSDLLCGIRIGRKQGGKAPDRFGPSVLSLFGPNQCRQPVQPVA